MSAFLDRYHNAYHTGTTVDLVNCPLCQDEFIAWQAEQRDAMIPTVDRMEDLPQYEVI